MRLADDFSAINRRLREIEAHRGFVLPTGVRIMIWESWESSHLTADEVATMDICFMLRQHVLVMVKSRTGTFVTSTGIDVLATLKRHFPSAAAIQKHITLSAEEARHLRSLIEHTPW